MARKPVFILMYYNYDDTDFEGVFSTKEAAERFIEKQLTAPTPYQWRQKAYYEILEEKVQ